MSLHANMAEAETASDEAGAIFDEGPVRFGLWYDMRNPPSAGRDSETFYRQVLDQIEWAERVGYRSVWLTEHHFVEDGYTPSPLVLGGAIASRTRKMRIGTSLMLLPLHDPVRLAEDSATLAIITGGRFDLGVGAGYRELEFEAFGRKVSHRGSLMEEGCAAIRRAWSGESIARSGRRFTYPDVHVTPVATTPPRLLIGAKVSAGIDRAARLGDGFLSTSNVAAMEYLDAVVRNGRQGDDVSVHAGQWAIVDDDPERTWARLGDYAVNQLNEYVRWGSFGPPDSVPRFADPDAVVAGGRYRLLDADEAVRDLVGLVRACPQIEDLYFWAQLPGESVESGTARAEFLIREVAPRVIAQLRRAGPDARRSLDATRR